MVGAVVSCVVGGCGLIGQVQGSLPIATPSVLAVVVVVVLMLRVFVIDYLCVSRLILFENKCLCTETKRSAETKDTHRGPSVWLVGRLVGCICI